MYVVTVGIKLGVVRETDGPHSIKHVIVACSIRSRVASLDRSIFAHLSIKPGL